MTRKQQAKGPWINRFAIRGFTLALALLVYWLLGFVVQDIKTIEGPDHKVMVDDRLDNAQVEKQDQIARQLRDLDRSISQLREEQRVAGEGSKNLQDTIAQLVNLQRLSLEKNISMSDAEQANLSVSLESFLASQKQYQELNTRIQALTREKSELMQQQQDVGRAIQIAKKPLEKRFRQMVKTHRLKLAAYQLAILLPVLILASFLLIRKRESMHFPLFLAFGGATLVKVVQVMHEYFPRRYFKYILIVALLLTVIRILIYFIRQVAAPKAQYLLRQYREAYERFFCPVCEYPIRTGPRKYMFWTRRSLVKTPLPKGADVSEEIYTCPSCGTGLFEKCASCGEIRHALLTHCCHCGAEKPLE